MKLSQQNLPELRQRVSCPTYDRQQLQSGVVHIGVGGFHRSHQAYYLHQLLQGGGAPEWGICGIGLREADRTMQDVLQRQDCLYTLITQHPDGTAKTEVIGSIHDYLLAVDDPAAVIDRMAHPATKIVSLTITEGGYTLDDTEKVAEPRTVFGYLTAALRKRRASGLPAFTVLSCDNIQHNGAVTRDLLLTCAEQQDADLAAWIAEEVTFPNSMVDRITPATIAEATEYLQREYYLEDAWCVICEPYIQWVVEDKFANGRPPLETVGVQFVPDVTPYEKMKLRLLNAGHSVLGIPGAIHGHPTIGACMGDPVFARFMRRFMDTEVTPVLDPVQGIDLAAYKDSLETRFANPNIRDDVGRICSESSAKLPKFLIPTIRENLERGGDIRLGTFILAAWCYYSDKQVNERSEPLEIVDELGEQLHRAAKGTEKDWTSFLHQPEIFGDLVQDARFAEEYTQSVRSIYGTERIQDAMKELLGDG